MINNSIFKETPGSWFSEYSKGFHISYSNVTDPQFKFLRLLSSKATQQFDFECSSSVGWFDEASGSYDKAIQLKAHNDDVIGYSPDEKRFTITEDSCAVSTYMASIEMQFNRNLINFSLFFNRYLIEILREM